MSKHQYTVENQDPEIEAQIKSVFGKLLNQTLDQIELLANNPIVDRSVVDPRSTNAGKNYLENQKGYENAMAARVRRIREAAALVEQLKTLLVMPRAKPDAGADANHRRIAALKELEEIEKIEAGLDGDPA